MCNTFIYNSNNNFNTSDNLFLFPEKKIKHKTGEYIDEFSDINT